MKYLFIMGGSGSGKTTLAKYLDKNFPEKFNRVLQVTTREKRDDEEDNVDYEFLSEYYFNKIKDDMLETVEYQFLPTKYGARTSWLDSEKWNIVVVCIEGFLSAMTNKFIKLEDEAILLNIKLSNGKAFINRDNRNASNEESLNMGVLRNFLSNDTILIDGKICDYLELSLDDVNKIETDIKNSKLSDLV